MTPQSTDFIELVHSMPKVRHYPPPEHTQEPIGIYCSLRKIIQARRVLKNMYSVWPSCILLPYDDWQYKFRLKLWASKIIKQISVPIISADDLGKYINVNWCLYGSPWEMRCYARHLAENRIQSACFLRPPEYGQGHCISSDELIALEPRLRVLRDRLADGDSREAFLSILKQRVSGDSDYVRLAPYGQYEHPQVCASEGDVILEAGAENGCHTIAFSNQVGPTGHVHAFEPDSEVLPKFVQLVGLRNNVTLVHSALGAENGTTKFVPDLWGMSHVESVKLDIWDFARETDGSNQPLPINVNEVPVTSIDNYVRDNKLTRVDMIKMDVEGSERDVLEGAKNTLLRFRPKLQISIYHKPNDLWELTEWVIQSVPNYKLFMGHHDWWYDTVLYAVNQET